MLPPHLVPPGVIEKGREASRCREGVAELRLRVIDLLDLVQLYISLAVFASCPCILCLYLVLESCSALQCVCCPSDLGECIVQLGGIGVGLQHCRR